MNICKCFPVKIELARNWWHILNLVLEKFLYNISNKDRPFKNPFEKWGA